MRKNVCVRVGKFLHEIVERTYVSKYQKNCQKLILVTCKE